MRTVIKPYKPKKMSLRMQKRFTEALSKITCPPMEKLKKNATEFEKLMMARRASDINKKI